jgi:catechol 2,3-dioxygenase-like lactoylglutathione lyase family enzyme
MPASNFHRQFGNPFDPRFHTRCYSQRPDFFKWFLHARAESQQDQIGEPGYSWRINFRVRDLDAMVAQLGEAGIPVVVEPTIYPNGRFAHLHDPNGNSIELWEPAGADLVRPTANNNEAS